MEGAYIDMESVKSKMVKLRNDKDAANDQAEQLDKQVKECQEAIHRTESDRADLNRKISNLEAENNNLQESMDTANHKIEEHEEKEKHFEEQVGVLNSRVQELEKEEESLLAEIKQLTEKLTAAETLSSDYKRQANKLRLDNEKLEKDLSDSEEKFNNVQQSMIEAMATLNEI